MPHSPRVFVLAALAVVVSAFVAAGWSAAAAADFTLAPAVAAEAEDFRVESGWKVIRNGQGNYMVDIVGFNHISGERLLGVDEKDATAEACPPGLHRHSGSRLPARRRGIRGSTERVTAGAGALCQLRAHAACGLG